MCTAANLQCTMNITLLQKKTLARKVLTVYIVFLISAAYILLLLITQGADANCAICTHTKNARQNARQNAHANCAESLPQI